MVALVTEANGPDVRVVDVDVDVDVDAAVLWDVLVLVLVLVEADVESAVLIDDAVAVDDEQCAEFPNPGHPTCVDREASPVDRDVYSVFSSVTFWFVMLKPVERDATPVRS
jgi:hypothetical protein